MGAGQSSDDGAEQAVAPKGIKTSYYELLGVEKDASDDDIKRAYRRKALELHPDRNYGNVEHATALFAEVQSAYEVLSDPQERAWYDSHEDAILRNVDTTRGEAGNYEREVGLTTADDITRMISKFHGGVKFTDAPSGFFGFLRETFDTLAREEVKAARQQGLEPMDYPSFGHKDDTHEDVVKTFYAVWASFSTKKTFSWRDRYNTAGIERRIRRMAEKENKAYREEGIREFNDAVRSLVAFVRKRDPRYKPSAQSEADRAKALREAAAAQAARMRAANAAKTEGDALPEWAKAREPEELEEESEGEESEEEHFECVACRKIFKSERQFEAHEKSKKHLKAVQSLRRRLEKDGVELDSNEVHTPSGVATPASDDVDNKIQTHEDVTEIIEPTENIVLEEDSAEVDPQDDKSEAESDVDIDESDEQSAAPTFTPPTNEGTDKDLQIDESPIETQTAPKMGKAAQKRAKKAAQTEQAQSSQFQCVSCNASFPSKTRLFQHIKDFGHAAPVPGLKTKAKKGKGK